MDLPQLKALVARYIEQIQLHEEDQIRLSELLQTRTPGGDGAYVFNAAPQSKHLERCQLYEARLQIHLYSVALRDAVDVLRVIEPELGEEYNFILEQKVKLLMTRLQFEECAYNHTRESAKSNYHHIFKNKWLMYKYGQEFKEFTGPIPRPGDIDPDIRYPHRKTSL
ncbi:hypothetical protein BGX23_000799 [Mortierella sp. AD031]|nr:hypothetical protein BGX23_000799 [Mortierella sp. AD031]